MATTTMTVPANTATSPGGGAVDTGDIDGFDLTTVTLNDQSLLVAVADSNELRSQGLMGVRSFGDVDGMVFAWEASTAGAFWMWTVPIPLDVAFFDEQGRLITVLEMAPCMEGPSSECPRYEPSGTYRYALEQRGGELADLPAGSVLEIDLTGLFQP